MAVARGEAKLGRTTRELGALKARKVCESDFAPVLAAPEAAFSFSATIESKVGFAGGGGFAVLGGGGTCAFCPNNVAVDGCEAMLAIKELGK